LAEKKERVGWGVGGWGGCVGWGGVGGFVCVGSGGVFLCMFMGFFLFLVVGFCWLWVFLLSPFRSHGFGSVRGTLQPLWEQGAAVPARLRALRKPLSTIRSGRRCQPYPSVALTAFSGFVRQTLIAKAPRRAGCALRPRRRSILPLDRQGLSRPAGSGDLNLTLLIHVTRFDAVSSATASVSISKLPRTLRSLHRDCGDGARYRNPQSLEKMSCSKYTISCAPVCRNAKRRRIPNRALTSLCHNVCAPTTKRQRNSSSKAIFDKKPSTEKD